MRTSLNSALRLILLPKFGTAGFGTAAIVTSPTGVGGGFFGGLALGSAVGSKIAAGASTLAYGIDYYRTGDSSSLANGALNGLSIVTSSAATKAYSNRMRQSRRFNDLSAPQRAKLQARRGVYGAGAGAATKAASDLLTDGGC